MKKVNTTKFLICAVIALFLLGACSKAAEDATGKKKPADNKPPLAEITPKNGQIDVVSTSVVSIKFSEKVSNVIKNNFQICPMENELVNCSLAVNFDFNFNEADNLVILSPIATNERPNGFSEATDYEVRININENMTDAANNPIELIVSSFSTTRAPQVTAYGPTAVSGRQATIYVEFSEAMSLDTISHIKVTQGGNDVPGQFVANSENTRFEFQPQNSRFEFATQYDIAVANVADVAKNIIAQPLGWSFSTGTPAILSVTPTELIAGETATINGEFFEDNAASGQIFINGKQIPQSLTWQNDKIEFNVPYGSFPGKIKVNVDGTDSNGMDTRVSWPIVKASDSQNNPQIIIDTLSARNVDTGMHNAIIVWVDYRNQSSGADIYAQRLLGSGEIDPAWPAGGLPVVTAPGWQSKFKATSDGNGGAYVVWEDERNGILGGADIYAHHITPTGLAQGWTSNGIKVVDAASKQTLSDARNIFSDLYILWEDSRSTTNVYMQKLLWDGTVAWANNGIAVQASANIQNDPRMAPESGNGMFVVWEESGNILAQRVKFDASKWQFPFTLCAAAGTQSEPNIKSSNFVAMASWKDKRNPNVGIYATRFYSNTAETGGERDPDWAADGNLIIETNYTSTQFITSFSGYGYFVSWVDRAREESSIISGQTIRPGDLYFQYSNVFAPGLNLQATGELIDSDGRNHINGVQMLADYSDIRHKMFWTKGPPEIGANLFTQALGLTNGTPLDTLTLTPQSPIAITTSSKVGGFDTAITGPSGTASFILTWSDGRSADTGTDIYATFISSGVYQQPQ